MKHWKNELGEDIYETEDGVRGKAIDFSNVEMNFEEQWCPNCHVKCKWDDAQDERVCPDCNYSICEEMIEDGEGYGSYEDSFRESF